MKLEANNAQRRGYTPRRSRVVRHAPPLRHGLLPVGAGAALRSHKPMPSLRRARSSASSRFALNP